MEISTLLNMNLSRFEEVANDWGHIAKRLDTAGESFEGSVSGPLSAEKKWSGDDAKEAARTCKGIRLDIDAVAKEAKAVQSFLEKFVSGDGEGFGNLRDHQRRVAELQQEALNKGLTVRGDGSVSWVVMREPGSLSPEEQQKQDEKDAQGKPIEDALKKILKDARDIDDTLKRGLRVIFGTEETFRTETRGRKVDDADMGDRWVEGQLNSGVMGYMAVKGWDDAVNLLDHYTEGSGKPVEVDADRMLEDMPAFERDVNGTLEGVKKGCDGPFETEWQNSAPNLNEGDASMNWYYALNNFQYRTVGEKNGDQITYHVEVQKRYDWGNPSEHRRDLEHFPVHFEQSEVARLNMVGLAKDFDVTGRTSTRTA